MADRGRPEIEITDKILELAESLAAQGLSKEDIARSLGFSYDTLNRRQKDNDAFADALAAGRAKGLSNITNALFTNAMSGNTTAQIFYLKNRDPANWKDRVPEAQGGDDLPPPAGITVTVVDGRKPDTD